MSNLTIINHNKHLIEFLELGSTVLTATTRLARELTLQFNEYRLSQKEESWESPDILTMEAWVYRFFNTLHHQQACRPDNAIQYPLILSTFQSRVLWEQIIADDISELDQDSNPLWNIPATATEAMGAWKLCQQWDITIDCCLRSYSADHRRFGSWAVRYQEQCARNNWVDKGTLPDEIACRIKDLDCSELSLVVCGFDSFTRQYERLFKKLTERGANISFDSNVGEPESENIQFNRYQDYQSQWFAAANWAREKTLNEPDCRIGIVVPDLANCRDLIQNVFTDVLEPQSKLDPVKSENSCYHIALGAKLSSYPVVAAALRVLDIALAAGSANTQISEFLLTPYMGGAFRERFERSQLELSLRSRLPFTVTISGLINTIKEFDSIVETPILVGILAAMNKTNSEHKGRLSHYNCAQVFLQLLKTAGWPGEHSLNSVEYQAATALEQEIVALGTADVLGKSVTTKSAISVLKRHLQERVFQPETPRKNIEVMGILECTGLEFDSIWFANLTEKEWPPPLNQPAFIPAKNLRESGYYGSSEALNLDRAEKMFNRIRHACPEIVLSRPCFDGGVALLPGFGFNDGESMGAPGDRLFDLFMANKPKLESYTAQPGLPLKISQASGGVSVIEDQAACPFRAYARHRLSAADTAHRGPGLEPMDQGILVHRTLEKVWAQLKSAENLRTLGNTRIQNLIDSICSREIAVFSRFTGMGHGFIAAVSHWLQEVVFEWLLLEQKRSLDFNVLRSEQKQTLSLPGLNLNFKIDRIDKLEDGTVALIDYKTGSPGSIREWFGDRPVSPQLPLYALSQIKGDNKSSPSMSCLTFAHVRSGQCSLVGLTSGESFLVDSQADKISNVEKAGIEDLDSWPKIIEYWKIQLETLANEFVAGYSAVDPTQLACSRCDLHSFCRIFDKPPQQDL